MRSSHFPGTRSAMAFRAQNTTTAPRTPPPIASRVLIILIMDPLLSGLRGSRNAARGGARPAHRPRTSARSTRPAVLDVLQRGVEILLTADPGGHALPEAARADRAGHLVGAVEPEHRGVLADLDDLLGDLVRVLGQRV